LTNSGFSNSVEKGRGEGAYREFLAGYMKSNDNDKIESVEKEGALPSAGETFKARPLKAHTNPLRLLVITTVAIFTAETIVMFLLTVFPDMPPLAEAFLDAFMLTVMIFPMLYFFSFRPLILHINERKRMEERNKKLIEELHEAIAEIKVLSGLLPICSSCKKIRDDKGYWTWIEKYIQEHSEAQFSHSICPDCAKKLYPKLYK
jgi:hypothetical protein